MKKDNFDLRGFLTENRITGNSQLMEEDYTYRVIPGKVVSYSQPRKDELDLPEAKFVHTPKEAVHAAINYASNTSTDWQEDFRSFTGQQASPEAVEGEILPSPDANMFSILLGEELFAIAIRSDNPLFDSDDAEEILKAEEKIYKYEPDHNSEESEMDEEYDESDDDEFLGARMDQEIRPEDMDSLDRLIARLEPYMQKYSPKEIMQFIHKKLGMGPKLEEARKKKKRPSAGLTKKKKSAIVKKARAGKDIGKKGKDFEKVAKAAGGGKKGQRIAAAQMWKSVKRK